MGKLWESRKLTKGKIVYKSNREGNRNLSYFNGIKKLNQRNENSGNRDRTILCVHSDQIILNSGSNALQFAKNEDFFNPMTISPSITAIPKNIFKAFFISSYLRLRGNGSAQV